MNLFKRFSAELLNEYTPEEVEIGHPILMRIMAENPKTFYRLLVLLNRNSRWGQLACTFNFYTAFYLHKAAESGSLDELPSRSRVQDELPSRSRVQDELPSRSRVQDELYELWSKADFPELSQLPLEDKKAVEDEISHEMFLFNNLLDNLSRVVGDLPDSLLGSDLRFKCQADVCLIESSRRFDDPGTRFSVRIPESPGESFQLANLLLLVIRGLNNPATGKAFTERSRVWLLSKYRVESLIVKAYSDELSRLLELEGVQAD